MKNKQNTKCAACGKKDCPVILSAQNKKTKEIIVMGQRRSGTSMISGILHYLGVPMGASAEQASPKNPKGFFEDRDIIVISEAMMAFTEGKWAQITENFFNEKETDKLIRYFYSWISETFKERRIDSRNGVWGFKDVNHIMFWDVYRKFLNNPYYITIERNQKAVARSLAHWHSRNPESYMPAIKLFKQEFDRFHEMVEEPLLKLKYEECLEEPEKTVDSIIKHCKLDVSEEKRSRAIAHISRDLNRHG